VAKNDQEEAFERILAANLARTIDFVKFAEAKNAALLTICSAWILAGLNLVTSRELPHGLNDTLWLSLPFFFLAALMALLSFLPRGLWRFDKGNDPARNLLFFMDIAATELGGLVKEIRARYEPMEDRSITDAYIADSCLQARINSQIASTKYGFFLAGVAFLLGGGVAIVVPATITIIRAVA
jgi:hypothetical protein